MRRSRGDAETKRDGVDLGGLRSPGTDQRNVGDVPYIGGELKGFRLNRPTVCRVRRLSLSVLGRVKLSERHLLCIGEDISTL